MSNIRQLISLLVVAAVAVFCLPFFDMIYLYPAANRVVTEKVSEDAEHLGRFLVRELANTEGQELRLIKLQQLVKSFSLVDITLRSPAGDLLLSTSENSPRHVSVPALNVLKRGNAFSRTFVIPDSKSGEPISLVEVHLPIMTQGHFDEVLILTQDISGVRSAFERLISRSAIFLFTVATVFFVVVILTARMALKAIEQQGASARQLVESQKQLELKHNELGQLFELVEQAKYEWQVALDCITDMVLLVDSAGKVRRCNEAFIRFIGRSYLDVLGKNWQQVLLREQQEVISLDQFNKQIYHQQKQVWLQLDFYSYRVDAREHLTVIRIKQQA